MNIAKKKSFRSGFTLIELLVVITIIGILAGLAIPGGMSVMEAARKAQAATMITNLRVALTSYLTEYGAWPTSIFPAAGTNPARSWGQVPTSQDLYLMLIGDPTSAENPRQIVFMEFSARELRNAAGGQPENRAAVTGFVDPWSNPYFIRVDANYSNVINNLPGNTTEINASMAIWSVGVEGGRNATQINTTNGTLTNAKYITSWGN